MNDPAITPFDSETGFRQAIGTVIAQARQELRVFDRDIQRLQLEQKASIAALEAFLSASRDNRLHIVLHDTSHLERYCPRLHALQLNHLQAMEIRQSPDELRHLAEVYVLADRCHGALRHHGDHPRGKLILDSADEIHPWWQRFDELWAHASPWSASRTGL